MNPTAACPVEEPSQVGHARRAAVSIAERLAFSEARAGQVALVVSELATNLARHAKRGEILLRPIREDGGRSGLDGLEILAIDAGPGMPDSARSRSDGHSTAGSLGQGLGAIERQSHFFELYTQPSGTVALARIWREPPKAAARQPRYLIGAVHVSKTGEDVCGDAWDWRIRDDRLAILVADGLGHGSSAHEAANLAIRIFDRSHEETPQRVIQDVHAGLRSTRGAAVSMIAIDLERSVARYSGVGNVSAVLHLATGSRHSLISHNGTAGHTAPRIQEFNYPVPAQSIVIVHTDGLGTHWDLTPYPGLRTHHPSVVAGILYRDFSRRRDDVTVVVAKEPEGNRAVPRSEKL
jgi:anti-sigma regulatory factor (Ser/Thr protein kinase)